MNIKILDKIKYVALWLLVATCIPVALSQEGFRISENSAFHRVIQRKSIGFESSALGANINYHYMPRPAGKPVDTSAAVAGTAGAREVPTELPDTFTLDPKWRAEVVSRATPGSFGDTYAVYTVVSSASAEATAVYRHCGFFFV
jgi:hypothetical protein